ncbi:hypothetical protein [Acinetobacter nosocomialis]|uniref:hypothetical protein n=1 Tax=Acinetobacter nosocomialis TaxID=106654 RepID=UPI0032B35217
MTTMFIDTNGEMSFVDNERLKFIMHYLKQGADDSLVKMKDGRFVREDSELSFTEIWLPAAEHQQRKIDELQAKVEGLQKQLIDQGQRFNEQAQVVKDLEFKNGELQKQVTDLDNRATQYVLDEMATAKVNEELQKRVDKAIQAINEYYESDGMSGLYFSDLKEILEGEQALKGEGQ